jgi:hypothetical protein
VAAEAKAGGGRSGTVPRNLSAGDERSQLLDGRLRGKKSFLFNRRPSQKTTTVDDKRHHRREIEDRDAIDRRD